MQCPLGRRQPKVGIRLWVSHQEQAEDPEVVEAIFDEATTTDGEVGGGNVEGLAGSLANLVD